MNLYKMTPGNLTPALVRPHRTRTPQRTIYLRSCLFQNVHVKCCNCITRSYGVLASSSVYESNHLTLVGPGIGRVGISPRGRMAEGVGPASYGVVRTPGNPSYRSDTSLPAFQRNETPLLHHNTTPSKVKQARPWPPSCRTRYVLRDHSRKKTIEEKTTNTLHITNEISPVAFHNRFENGLSYSSVNL